jgi:hypothetical protein
MMTKRFGGLRDTMEDQTYTLQAQRFAFEGKIVTWRASHQPKARVLTVMMDTWHLLMGNSLAVRRKPLDKGHVAFGGLELSPSTLMT